MHFKLAVAALLCGLTLGAAPPGVQPLGPPGPSAEPAAPSVPAPTGQQTAEFTGFFTTVLAGHVPGGNISSQVRQGFTQPLLSQMDAAYTGLGKFRGLQFVRTDTMEQYVRYHYSAVFENGSQGVMFILDSNGTIVGFFQDKSG